MKEINTLRGQNAAFLMLRQVVHASVVTTGLYMGEIELVSFTPWLFYPR
jgi:hypothetical protein